VNWTSYTKVRSPLAIAGQSCAARIPGPRPWRAVDGNVREAIVRIITARPGLEQVDAAMAALTPALILAADRPSR
jgi:hypothetical protein